jgi:hypothetical protein
MKLTSRCEPPDARLRLLRERALRLALLIDALRCLGTTVDRHPDRCPDVIRRAERWVRRRDRQWPFSFDNVCDALDIDGEGLRAHVLRRLERRRSTAPAG